MGFNATACPCGTYEGDFSSQTECGENQLAGNEETALLVCEDKLESFMKIACDSTLPNSGQYTDFVLKSGETAAVVYTKCNSILDESEEIFDEETCTTTINEVITFKGRTDNKTNCFLRSYNGKDSYMILCGKDGQVKIYNGMISTHKHTSGAKSGDYIGVDVTFTNTVNAPFSTVDLSINFGGDPEAFFTALITA